MNLVDSRENGIKLMWREATLLIVSALVFSCLAVGSAFADDARKGVVEPDVEAGLAEVQEALDLPPVGKGDSQPDSADDGDALPIASDEKVVDPACKADASDTLQPEETQDAADDPLSMKVQPSADSMKQVMSGNGADARELAESKAAAIEPSADKVESARETVAGSAQKEEGSRFSQPSIELSAGANAGSAQEEDSLTAQSAKRYDTPLASGDYYFQSTLGGSYMLDVSGGSKASGGNVQIYTSNQTDAQKWHVTFDADGLYTIANVNSGKPLDLQYADASSGRNVQQYAGNGTGAQRWVVTRKGKAFAIASSIDTRYVLDVSGGAAYDGNNVQVWKANGTPAQLFWAVPVEASMDAERVVDDGMYTIASAGSPGYVLDVAGGSSANCANVQLYESNGTYAQKWGVLWNKAGYYSIFNIGSGKDLDVAGGSIAAGANVAQYKANGTRAQQWALLSNADGTYTLANALSGMVLDVAGGAFRNSSNVQVYASNGTAAQRFVLSRIDAIEDGVYAVVQGSDTRFAVDVAGSYTVDGAQLKLLAVDGSPAQRVILSKEPEGKAFTLQFVASGKYLADEDGRAVQASRATTSTHTWTASFGRGGYKLRNSETGRYLGFEQSTLTSPAGLTTGNAQSARGFYLERHDLVDDGYYALTPLSSLGRRVDVENGSRKSGANVQIYNDNGTQAQTFYLSICENGTYRLAMSFTGNVIEVAGASSKPGANVRMGTWTGSDSQTWEIVVSDGGLMVRNRCSGLYLGVAGDGKANGSNVEQQSLTGRAAQRWALTKCSLDRDRLGFLVAAIEGADSSNTLAINVLGSARYPSKGTVDALIRAVDSCTSRGYSVGFMLTDLSTASTVTFAPDAYFYSASAIKGPYVTHIFQEFLETGDVGRYDVDYLIEPCIAYSDNDAYESLRNWFGSYRFDSWLEEVDLGSVSAARWYPDLTARQMHLMWAHIYDYEESSGSNTGWWKDTFCHSYYSSIYYELGDSCTVYSKPGWYPPGYDLDAFNDSGIVVCGDGSKYLLTILSTIDCYNADWLERDLVRALHNMHASMQV